MREEPSLVLTMREEPRLTILIPIYHYQWLDARGPKVSKSSELQDCMEERTPPLLEDHATRIRRCLKSHDCRRAEGVGIPWGG